MTAGRSVTCRSARAKVRARIRYGDVGGGGLAPRGATGGRRLAVVGVGMTVGATVKAAAAGKRADVGTTTTMMVTSAAPVVAVATAVVATTAILHVAVGGLRGASAAIKAATTLPRPFFLWVAAAVEWEEG